MLFRSGVEHLDAAADFDHGLEVVVPRFGAGARGQGPDPRRALLDSVAAAQIGLAGLFDVGPGPTERLDRSGQFGMVALEWDQQVAAGGEHGRNCFFEGAERRG